ncbi:MAG TPA: FlgD immunoglobulin-like domain containing protein, partial [Candidatus Eisenbacteria bacterium]
FIDRVAIGPPPPDSVCAEQAVTVALAGHFPDACHVLKDVQLIDVSASPYLKPPIVRVIVGMDACPTHGCATVVTPWGRMVILRGLPAGAYRLPLEVQLDSTDCDGAVTGSHLDQSGADFAVGTCTVGRCLVATWDHAQRDGICDDTVSVTRPASVTLGISTPVALAGLQGRIRLSPAGLRVTNLNPVGPAAGMHLLWAADPDGARFLLYADSGAPIPATPASDPPVPVLRVTAEVTPGVGTPPVTSVQESDLLGSDEAGAGVPECPILWATPTRFADPSAHICFVAPCDLNGDGIADIRDLVVMIHCILGTGTCPPDAAGHMDCNGDGVVGIDDVICCARSMLRSTIAPGATPRPEPGVGVSFGVPSRSEIGIDLPVRVRGIDRLGAARVAIGFPDDRYTMSWIDGPTNAGSWLRIEETQGGRLDVGLIAARPDPSAASLDFVVHLARKPGQAPGGALRLLGGEFAGPDGAALQVTLDQPDFRLDGPTGLGLSPARPNPFMGSTRVTVSLTRPTEIEATIHDLNGRLVTVVYHGTLGPGSYPFDWNGARADGSAAPNGLYFFRVRAGGELQARKVIFLPHN